MASILTVPGIRVDTHPIMQAYLNQARVLYAGETIHMPPLCVIYPGVWQEGPALPVVDRDLNRLER